MLLDVTNCIVYTSVIAALFVHTGSSGQR